MSGSSSNNTDSTLTIKARDLSSQPIEDVVRAVNNLGAALTLQATLADRGEASMKGLNAALADSKQGLAALLAQRTSLEQFIQTTEKLVAAQGQQEKAGDRMLTARDNSAQVANYAESFKASLPAARKDQTAEQRDTMRALKEGVAAEAAEVKKAEAEYRQAENAVARLDKAYQSQGAALERLGVDLRATSASAATLDAAIARSADVLARAGEATASFALNKQRANAIAEQAARLAGEEAAALAGLAKQEEQDYESRLRAYNLDVKINAARLKDVDAQHAAQAELERFRNTAFQARQNQPTPSPLGASPDVQAQFKDASAALLAVQNPAAAARASLDGVVAEIRRVGEAFDSGKLATQQFGEAAKSLSAGQASLRGFAGLVDEFKTQEAAAKAAQAAYTAADARLAALAETVRHAAEPSAALANETKLLTRDVQSAYAAFEKSNFTLTESKQALEAAGLDYRNLDAAIGKIAGTAEFSLAAVAHLNAALETEALLAFQKTATDTASAVPAISALGQSPAPATGFSAASKALAAVQDPASAARASLDSVVQELAILDASLQRGKISTDTYSAALAQFGEIQSSLKGFAGLIDGFQAQEAATKRAEAAYLANEQALSELTIGILKADAPSKEMAADQERLAKATTTSATAFERENAKLTEFKARMAAASIDTRNLGGALSSIVGSATTATASTERLTAAVSGGGTGGFLGLKGYEIPQLGYELDHTFRQLASGASVFTTAAEQAPQILLLFGDRLKGLLPFLGPIGVAIAVVSAAVEVLSHLLAEAATERGFEGRLQATADASIYSAHALVENERAIRGFGASAEDARKAVDGFTSAGLNPALIERFGKTAQNMVDTFGIKMPDAVKLATDAFLGDFDAIEKLDRQYNFLTAAQENRIRVLAQEGNLTAAQALAFDIFEAKQAAGAQAAKSVYAVAHRELSKAFDDLFTSIAHSNVVQTFVQQLTELLNVLNSIVKVTKGELSLKDFFSQLAAGASGMTPASDVEKQVAALQAQREAIMARVNVAGTLKSAGKELDEPALAEDRRQVAAIDAQIKALQGDGRLAALRAELDQVERQINAVKGTGNLLTPENIGKGQPQGPAIPGNVQSAFSQATAGRDPAFLRYFAGIIKQESNFNPNVKDGTVGEIGLGQIKPSTAMDPGFGIAPITGTLAEVVAKLRDPVTNLTFAANYAAAAARRAGVTDLSTRSGVNNSAQVYNAGRDKVAYGNSVERNAFEGGEQDLGKLEARRDKLKADLAQQAAKPAQGEAGQVPDAVGVPGQAKPGDAGKPLDNATGTEELRAHTEALKKQTDQYAELLRVRLLAFTDEKLHNQDALDQENRQLQAFREKQIREAQAAHANLDDPAVKARLQEEYDREEQKLTEAREMRDKRYNERKRAAAEALAAALAAIAAKVDNQDKTNIEARIRAIDEEFEKSKNTVAKALAEKVIDPAGAAEFNAKLESYKNSLKEKVTVEGEDAIIKAFQARSKEELDTLDKSFKSGAVSADAYFKQRADIVTKYGGLIKDAVDKANASLRTLGGSTPSVGIQAAIAANDNASADAKGDKDPLVAYKAGFAQLQEFDKANKDVRNTQKELVAKGLETTSQGEDAIKKSFDSSAVDSGKLIVSLQAQLDHLLSIGSISTATYDDMSAKLKLVAADTQYVSQFQQELEKTFENSVVSNASRAFDTIGQAIGNLAAGTGKIKDVFVAVGQAAGQFAAGVLRDVAQMIIKYELLALVQSAMGNKGGAGGTAGGSTGGIGSLIGSLAGSGASSEGADAFAGAGTEIAALAHAGGIVGSLNMSRAIDPAWFDNAPRFHTGGMVGLAHDEQAAILKRGEEVLTESDPRNALNGGKNGQPSQQARSLRNVLVLDPKDLSAAMAGSHGEEVVINHIKNNAGRVRQAIGAR